jgi:beta-phosphoglucomutase-like phosphatase (HAD superfamily)
MPVHFAAWRETMNRYGIQFCEDRFYALGGMPSAKIAALLAQEQGVVIDAAKAAHEKEMAFVENIGLLVPIEPVMSVASYFRGRRPIAVASGGYREIIRKQLEQIGCADWFEATVTAEDTLRHKPDPDVFLRAAELLNVPAHGCLVYEDSVLGLEAARAAGMDAIDIRSFHVPQRVQPVGNGPSKDL